MCVRGPRRRRRGRGRGGSGAPRPPRRNAKSLEKYTVLRAEKSIQTESLDVQLSSLITLLALRAGYCAPRACTASVYVPPVSAVPARARAITRSRLRGRVERERGNCLSRAQRTQLPNHSAHGASRVCTVLHAGGPYVRALSRVVWKGAEETLASRFSCRAAAMRDHSRLNGQCVCPEYARASSLSCVLRCIPLYACV